MSRCQNNSWLKLRLREVTLSTKQFVDIMILVNKSTHSFGVCFGLGSLTFDLGLNDMMGTGVQQGALREWGGISPFPDQFGDHVIPNWFVSLSSTIPFLLLPPHSFPLSQ